MYEFRVWYILLKGYRTVQRFTNLQKVVFVVKKISCQLNPRLVLIDFWTCRELKFCIFSPSALGHRGADDQRDRGRFRRLPEGGAGGARRGGLQPFSHRQQGHRTVNIEQQESVNGGETSPLPDSCLFWLRIFVAPKREDSLATVLLFTFERLCFLVENTGFYARKRIL